MEQDKICMCECPSTQEGQIRITLLSHPLVPHSPSQGLSVQAGFCGVSQEQNSTTGCVAIPGNSEFCHVRVGNFAPLGRDVDSHQGALCFECALLVLWLSPILTAPVTILETGSVINKSKKKKKKFRNQIVSLLRAEFELCVLLGYKVNHHPQCGESSKPARTPKADIFLIDLPLSVTKTVSSLAVQSRAG